MPSASRRDRWSAAGLALFAVFYLFSDRRYPLDTLATPGPGLFPLAAGLVLLICSLWQLATAGRDAPPAPRAAEPVTRPYAPWVMAAVLAVYAAVMPLVGFVPTSIALVIAGARLMGLPGWWRPASLALGVTLMSRLVFGTWLGVPLP